MDPKEALNIVIEMLWAGAREKGYEVDIATLEEMTYPFFDVDINNLDNPSSWAREILHGIEINFWEREKIVLYLKP